MNKWKESLKRLIETPPVMGVDIIESPIETCAKELVGQYDLYIRKQVAVHCDPDVLEQTARKNAELMAKLAETHEKLESGELVEVVRCKDCEFWSRREGCHPFEHLHRCYRQYGAAMSAGDYCSLGEKGECIYD